MHTVSVESRANGSGRSATGFRAATVREVDGASGPSRGARGARAPRGAWAIARVRVCRDASGDRAPRRQPRTASSAPREERRVFVNLARAN